MLKSLYNTEINKKHCIGFCHHHRCYITCKQLKHKECLKKQCHALERYDHEYWRQRELIKIKKKNRSVH